MSLSPETAKFDYEQTLETYRQLTDIRFKLLAFVPALSGAAIALLTRSEIDGLEGVGLAGLGFVVTLGIALYDQRNTVFYNGAIGRAKFLEWRLGLERFGGDRHRGLFGSRGDLRGLALAWAACPARSRPRLCLLLGAWSLDLCCRSRGLARSRRFRCDRRSCYGDRVLRAV